MKAIKERLDNRISRLHFHIVSRLLAIRHSHKNKQIAEKETLLAVAETVIRGGNAMLNQAACKVRIVHSAGCKAAVLARSSNKVKKFPDRKINNKTCYIKRRPGSAGGQRDAFCPVLRLVECSGVFLVKADTPRRVDDDDDVWK